MYIIVLCFLLKNYNKEKECINMNYSRISHDGYLFAKKEDINNDEP